MSSGLIRAVVVGTCLGSIGAVAGCELLVELDRSAVSAGGSEGGDEGEDASVEAGTVDSGADAPDADVAPETSTTDSGADTEQ